MPLDNRIISYYTLCSIKSKSKKPIELEEKVVDWALGEKNKILYLKKDETGYKIKETVIGAGKQKILII